MQSEKEQFLDANLLRSNAEAQLKELHKKEDVSLEEADLKRLFHELQVHQIELEMQNEELRNAYEVAEAALKKHTLLFDLSPMGYFTLDAEGTISELNFTGAELLGEKRISLIGSNFKLFISEDSKAVFNTFLKELYTSQTKESCQVLLGYDNKSLCSVYIEGIIIEDDHKCLLSVLDISKFNYKNK